MLGTDDRSDALPELAAVIEHANGAARTARSYRHSSLSGAVVPAGGAGPTGVIAAAASDPLRPQPASAVTRRISQRSAGDTRESLSVVLELPMAQAAELLC